MAKFNVGDRVRILKGETPEYIGKSATVLEVDANGWRPYKLRGDFSEVIFRGEKEIELSNDLIRIITRREIVPGTYGGVTVEGDTVNGKDIPFVRFYAQADVEQLRKAARIFNEIADALDENAKEVA